MPVWSTKVLKSASGREVRASYYSYPIYKFALQYSVLRATTAQAELQALMGFFNARQGSFDTFLYDDVDDNTATAQTIGIGDGGTVNFQLVRLYGGYVEPVLAPKANPIIMRDGVAQNPSAYQVSGNGVLTFNAAPAIGAVVSWTGGFYYRCRFTNDTTEFEQFMQRLWSAKKIEFVSVKA